MRPETEKQLTSYRKRAIGTALKKCLRTSKIHLRIKAGKYTGVFDRGFCQGAKPIDFIKKIDGLMDKGQIIKNDDTSYVSRMVWNGKDVVVKRYNHKGFIHSLRHTIKKSRAWRNWLHANRLRMLNITTPKPLAYVEKRKALLVWNSYLVTKYAEGQSLDSLLRGGNVTKQQRAKVAGQIMELLDKLGRYHISHGDLKHSNILITESGPTIIDLDAMTMHKWDWLYKLKRAKDLGRFAKQWASYPCDFG